MKKIFTFFGLILLYQTSLAQELTANELLAKTIAYHDPHNNWPTFKGKLNVISKTPEKLDRTTEIVISLADENFHARSTRDAETSNYIITKGKCIVSQIDSLRIANLIEKPKRSHCETTKRYSNYYLYLYGLPMKLKDPGTLIDPKLEKRSFKGVDYWVLKVTYDEEVGTDIWYFYFDLETYAMKVYQFFRNDTDGNLNKESGEYILLSEEQTINGIKMPKTRAWYYNKDEKYLGTDILN